jgi:sugar transferase (PEP-CTERM/EpsH1 system associated)
MTAGRMSNARFGWRVATALFVSHFFWLTPWYRQTAAPTVASGWRSDTFTGFLIVPIVAWLVRTVLGTRVLWSLAFPMLVLPLTALSGDFLPFLMEYTADWTSMSRGERGTIRACPAAAAPLVAHVIYRLDVGGLENGVVNLINRIPPERYRHVIISMTTQSEFRRRIERTDVPVLCLNKPPGNSVRVNFKLWSLFRQLRPEIVHTRNIGALEAALPAACASVPVRVHGEHGKDVGDLHGNNLRRQRVRKLFKPFVHHYIGLSQELVDYLKLKVGVPQERIEQIYNGVDAEKFHPRGSLGDEPSFAGAAKFVIGTVGRMQAVKDQVTLARAFVLLMKASPAARERTRLVMVGDGPLREPVHKLLVEAGLEDRVWLAGQRDDIPGLMRDFDLFVLPSLAEGISNTILEAMASGLPVLATAVGGNPELVAPGVTGTLVPPSDPERMARAIQSYVDAPERGLRQGAQARRVAECRFSMEAMVMSYMATYDRLLDQRGLGRSHQKTRGEHPMT